jgi:hypothetical protein
MAVKKHRNNWAIFTPSVSQMYVLAHAKAWPRQPIPFDPLNFLDSKNEFNYPFALYSAGHAYLDPAKSDEREPMIQNRDRENTVMVGDSGGFQAATGVLDFDWENPLGQKAIDKRIELIKWLEHTADYSMILDWPAWAINTGRLPSQLMIADPTTNPLVETNDPFHNCLNGTVWNNHFFIKHRTPGATKFLNVLQGRSIDEAYEWYDAVTPFSDTKKYSDRAFEGWALGGSTGGDPSLTMRLLIKLRDDGLLDGDDRWIHVLGRSRLTTAAYLTALNQALTEHVNPNCQISFDAASAFLYAVNGNYVVDWQVNPKGLNLISNEFPMHEKYIGSEEPFIYNGVSAERLADPTHYKTTVAKQLKMGDFILQSDPDAKKPYRMDTASYYYIMGHNVQMQINAVHDVCEKMDRPDAVKYIPTIFLEYKEFVHELFTTEKPMELIEKEGNRYRDLISGERPGTSALEDHSMFPKTATLQTAPERKSRAKVVKPVKVEPAVVNDGLFKF